MGVEAKKIRISPDDTHVDGPYNLFFKPGTRTVRRFSCGGSGVIEESAVKVTIDKITGERKVEPTNVKGVIFEGGQNEKTMAKSE